MLPFHADESVDTEKTVWGSPAGKKRLSKKLAAMIPKGHTTYVEPFAGSAAVLFAMDKVETEVLNDMDPEISFAFKAIATMTDAEFKSLSKKSWVGSKETYKRLFKQWKSGASLGKVDRLYRFLYLAHFSFGKLRGGSFNPGADGITSQTIKKVEKARKRLKGIKVFSKDYRAVCSKFDGAKTFFFLDPPYVGSDALNRQDREGARNGTGEKSFDEEAFYKFLKTIKGKFLITYGVTGKKDWPGFKIGKITSPRGLASMPGVKGPKTLSHLLISNYTISKADITKALGDDWEYEPIVKGMPSGKAEGGIHVHALERENMTTKLDGLHTHTFLSPDGKLIETEEDGQHTHKMFSYEDGPSSIGHDGEHVHVVKLADGTKLRTEVGGYHGHDSQVESTAFDGSHSHKLVLPDMSIVESMTTTDAWRHGGEKPQAGKPAARPASELAKSALGHLRTFKLRSPFIALSEGNLYVRTDKILKAVESAVAEMLPPDIARDVCVVEGSPAGHYVEAADLVVDVRSEFVAKQAVAKRIETNDDGEYCVIADSGRNMGCFGTKDEAEARLRQIEQFSKAIPYALTAEAVAKGWMPEDGSSGLPSSLEQAVPASYRYWKAEGEEARSTRDALYDSGFFADDNVRMVNGQPTRVVTKMYVYDPGATGDDETLATREGFREHVAPLIKQNQGVLWTVDEFPSAKVADQQVLVFDPDVVKGWLDTGRESLDSLVRKVADLDHAWLLPVPDSLGARAALSRTGRVPFLVRKASTMGWVFAASIDVAKATIEMVGLDGLSEDDRRKEFTLSRQVWKGRQSVWHLLLDRRGDGLESWVLQGSPIEKSTVVGIQRDRLKKAMLDFSGEVAPGASIGDDILNDSDGASEVWVEDRGTVCVLEETPTAKRVRIEGDKLCGEFVLHGRGADSIWRMERVGKPIEPAPLEPAAVSKRYDVSELVEKADEERFVYGIVLEPEVVDSQGDVYSEAEVRDAAHKFIAEFQNIGIQHSKLAKQVDILESFLAPTAFKEGSRSIKKGTWLLAVRVKDDRVWRDIKAGKFTGFSIGGNAIRRPEKG
jgi:site-specific DNA-adenine methylase